MPRHVYHFQGQYQARPGDVGYLDGTLSLPEPVLSHESYLRLKQAIAQQLAIPVEPDRLILCALTPLGKIEDE